MAKTDFENLDKKIKNAAAVIINPNRNSIVYLTGAKAKHGGYIVVSFKRNVDYFGDIIHQATTIHPRENINGLLNNLGADANVFIFNEKALNKMLSDTEIQSLQLLASVEHRDRIAQKNEEVNNNNQASIKELSLRNMESKKTYK